MRFTTAVLLAATFALSIFAVMAWNQMNEDRTQIAGLKSRQPVAAAAPQPDYRVTLARLYEIEQPALQPAPAPRKGRSR